MNAIRHVTIAAILAAAALPAFAHGGATPGMSPPAANATPAQRGEWMGRLETQMKSMREMHERFDAAKTTEERNALMSEQARLMNDGMSMMGGTGQAGMMGGATGMHKGSAPASNTNARMQMLEGRLEMMQHMMQMMMDRDMPMADRMQPAPAKK